MLKFNSSLYPPDGYVFTDHDGTRHRGEGWNDLVRRVSEYRQINNLPLGDVEQEIHAQACSKTPALCADTSAPLPPLVRQHTGSMTFNQKVLEWLTWMVGQKRINAVRRVDSDVAAARARVCASCPKQKALLASCDACITAAARSRDAILEGKSEFAYLNPCEVTGEDCQITVNLDLPRLTNPDLPPSCWRL